MIKNRILSTILFGLLGVSTFSNAWEWDLCEGGIKTYSDAKAYCESKGMELPDLRHTTSRVNGNIPSCEIDGKNQYTWTKNIFNSKYDSYYTWKGDNKNNSHKYYAYDDMFDGAYVRCLDKSGKNHVIGNPLEEENNDLHYAQYQMTLQEAQRYCNNRNMRLPRIEETSDRTYGMGRGGIQQSPYSFENGYKYTWTDSIREKKEKRTGKPTYYVWGDEGFYYYGKDAEMSVVCKHADNKNARNIVKQDNCEGGMKKYNDAVKYCASKGMRLPTAKEVTAWYENGEISNSGHDNSTWLLRSINHHAYKNSVKSCPHDKRNGSHNLTWTSTTNTNFKGNWWNTANTSIKKYAWNEKMMGTSFDSAYVRCVSDD